MGRQEDADSLETLEEQEEAVFTGEKEEEERQGEDTAEDLPLPAREEKHVRTETPVLEYEDTGLAVRLNRSGEQETDELLRGSEEREEPLQDDNDPFVESVIDGEKEKKKKEAAGRETLREDVQAKGRDFGEPGPPPGTEHPVDGDTGIIPARDPLSEPFIWKKTDEESPCIPPDEAGGSGLMEPYPEGFYKSGKKWFYTVPSGHAVSMGPDRGDVYPGVIENKRDQKALPEDGEFSLPETADEKSAGKGEEKPPRTEDGTGHGFRRGKKALRIQKGGQPAAGAEREALRAVKGPRRTHEVRGIRPDDFRKEYAGKRTGTAENAGAGITELQSGRVQGIRDASGDYSGKPPFSGRPLFPGAGAGRDEKRRRGFILKRKGILRIRREDFPGTGEEPRGGGNTREGKKRNRDRFIATGPGNSEKAGLGETRIRSGKGSLNAASEKGKEGTETVLRFRFLHGNAAAENTAENTGSAGTDAAKRKIRMFLKAAAKKAAAGSLSAAMVIGGIAGGRAVISSVPGQWYPVQAHTPAGPETGTKSMTQDVTEKMFARLDAYGIRTSYMSGISGPLSIHIPGYSVSSAETRDGDSQIILAGGGRCILIDGGCASLSGMTREYLESRGITNLTVFITHWHYDHYGCLSGILEEGKIHVDALFCPPPEEILGIEPAGALAGKRITEEVESRGGTVTCPEAGRTTPVTVCGLDIEIWRERPGTGPNGETIVNDTSMLLYFPSLYYLACGDMINRIPRFLETMEGRTIRFFQIPHHGNGARRDLLLLKDQGAAACWYNNVEPGGDMDNSSFPVGAKACRSAGYEIFQTIGDINITFSAGRAVVSGQGKTFSYACPFYPSGQNTASSGAGSDLVSFAMQWVDRIPYKSSVTGNDPDDERYEPLAEGRGSDCSWFVFHCLEHFGILTEFVHSYEWGSEPSAYPGGVEIGDDISLAQPGDILCYAYGYPRRGDNSHVTIYTGNNEQVGCEAGYGGVTTSGVDTGSLLQIVRFGGAASVPLAEYGYRVGISSFRDPGGIRIAGVKVNGREADPEGFTYETLREFTEEGRSTGTVQTRFRFTDEDGKEITEEEACLLNLYGADGGFTDEAVYRGRDEQCMYDSRAALLVRSVLSMSVLGSCYADPVNTADYEGYCMDLLDYAVCGFHGADVEYVTDGDSLRCSVTVTVCLSLPDLERADKNFTSWEALAPGGDLNPLSYMSLKKTDFEKVFNVSLTSPARLPGTVFSGTEQEVYSFFAEKGLGAAQIAAVMANVKEESAFNPEAYNTETGAGGLFQWTGERLSGLKDYAASRGMEWTNAGVQLEYAWKEIDSAGGWNGEAVKRTQFLGTGDARQAAVLFCIWFERRVVPEQAEIRGDIAEDYYSRIMSAGSPAGMDYLQWAVRTAGDDSHGYSQPHRGGNPDYDCSSFVYFALKNTGFDVGEAPFTTYTMGRILERCGFRKTRITDREQMQAGDILWSIEHTELYLGSGRAVGAHSDENGGIRGDETGDQTGGEISVTDAGDWEYVYRKY